MKYKLLLTFFVVGFLISVVLSLFPVSKICEGDNTGGCNAVQSSSYAKVFGISNNYIGIIAFLILILITISHMRKPKAHKRSMITIGVIISSAIALYFLYLQFFIINAICKYCIVVDISCILGLIVVLIYWED